MELKVYIEKWTQEQDDLSIREKIEEGRKHLFDFEYPIFNEDFRKVFETHFIRNFYMREIGFETEGLFKFRLETWLMINMPYWNKMFESEQLKYDPLMNSAMDTTSNNTKDHTTTQTQNSDSHNEGQSTDDQTSETTQDNFGRSIESDNPDSRLQLTTNDGEGVIEYASRIGEDTENNKQNGTANTQSNASNDETRSSQLDSQINDIEDFVQSRSGKVGSISYPELVQKYREALLRIERLMFYEMNQLFMLVY